MQDVMTDKVHVIDTRGWQIFACGKSHPLGHPKISSYRPRC